MRAVRQNNINLESYELKNKVKNGIFLQRGAKGTNELTGPKNTQSINKKREKEREREKRKAKQVESSTPVDPI